jgi:hypothetical protein
MLETVITAILLSTVMTASYNFMLSWITGEMEKPEEKTSSKTI